MIFPGIKDKAERDDVIAYLVLLLRRCTLELLDGLLPLCFGNGDSPRMVGPWPSSRHGSGLQITIHEVDLL